MNTAIASRWLYRTILLALGIVYALPFAWMVMSSMKTNQQIFDSPLALPSSIDWGVWAEAWNTGGLGKYALNSVIVTTVSVLAILVCASMAAFALTYFDFNASKLLLGLFAAGLLLPLHSYFIAQNYLFEEVGLKGGRLSLMIPYAAMGLPLAVYLLRVYLMSIPAELFEAARIDGASDTRIFYLIVVPLLKPGLATVAIFSALNAWNEFLLALLYVSDDDLKTIPTGLLAFSSRYVTDYQLLFAALTIVTLPMLAVYVAFHRQITAGLTDGSLK